MTNYINIRDLLHKAKLPETKAAMSQTGFGTIFSILGPLLVFSVFLDASPMLAGVGLGILFIGIFLISFGKILEVLHDIRTLLLIERSEQTGEDS